MYLCKKRVSAPYQLVRYILGSRGWINYHLWLKEQHYTAHAALYLPTMQPGFIRAHNKDQWTMSKALKAFGGPLLLNLSVFREETLNLRLWPHWEQCAWVYMHVNNIPFAMATVASSSRRSSSTYSSSARYSTSSSYRSEGSLGGSSDSLDPLFEPFLDSADHSSLFGEEGHGGHGCLAPFSRHGRPSYGHTGKKTDSYLNCSYSDITPVSV